MKLRSITIQNMHGVTLETYDFKDCTYLVGPNGAGKSTVLEAIQLALLGYIPGYSKKNADIMKHSSSVIMTVEATLDDNGKEVTIHRTWQGTSSISSNLITSPEGYDISSILSEIELPIFNFNEFKNMTANKLKEWFIDFMPSTDAEIDWGEKLLENPLVQTLEPGELLEEVMARIESSDATGLEKIKLVNNVCKELQSFYKGQVSNLEKTANSLVYYDNCEAIDEAEANDRLNRLSNEKSLAIQYNQQQIRKQQLTQEHSQAVKVLEKYESITEPELNKVIVDAEAQIARLRRDSTHYMEVLSNWKVVRDKRSLVTATTCPFITDKECEDLKSIVEEAKADVEEATEYINDANQHILQINNKIAELDKQRKEAQVTLNTLSQTYSRIKFIESELAQINELGTTGAARNISEIDADIAATTELMSKVIANKRYNELQQTVTADKFKAENNLNILKIWDKLTGANGLQSEVMDKPFETLAENVTTYLKLFFSDDVQAYFNIQGKANSFAFGIVKDDAFIEFDCLSSGERCLYTLALMMCIVERIQPKLKLILIDDILDHLDDENAGRFFDAITGIDDIQFILAGVKPCKLNSICVEIK